MPDVLTAVQSQTFRNYINGRWVPVDTERVPVAASQGRAATALRALASGPAPRDLAIRLA